MKIQTTGTDVYIFRRGGGGCPDRFFLGLVVWVFILGDGVNRLFVGEMRFCLRGSVEGKGEEGLFGGWWSLSGGHVGWWLSGEVVSKRGW